MKMTFAAFVLFVVFYAVTLAINTDRVLQLLSNLAVGR